MPTIALIAGGAALIAGIVKYGMDVHRASHTAPQISVFHWRPIDPGAQHLHT